MRPGYLCAALLSAALAARSTYAQSVQQMPAPEGWAALERGDADKAAAIFREELERSPGNAALNYGAGCLRFRSGGPTPPSRI